MSRARNFAAATAAALVAVLFSAVLVEGPATAAATASLAGNAGQSGVTITVYPAGGPDAAVVATTGSDGSFSVSGLDDGTYEIAFSKPSYVKVWYGGGESRSTATPVALAGEGPVVLDPVTLDPGGYLEGTVRTSGAATSSAQVRVLKLLDGAWVPESASYAYTNSSGQFTYHLSTLQPVKVYAYTGPTAYKRYRVYYGDAFSLQTATSLTIDPGATISGVDIDAPASGTLTGGLANAFGGPLGGEATVYARDHGQVVPLELEQLSPLRSSYTSGFSAPAPAGVDLTYSGTSRFFTPAFLGDVPTVEDATFTSVLPGGTRSGPAVRLPGGLGIRARIVQPVWNGSSSRLGAEGLDVTGWAGDTLMSRATTDANGRFRLPGLSENTPHVQVRVAGDGIDTVWLRGFGSDVTGEQSAATAYSLYGDTSDEVLNDFPVTYAADRQLAATSGLDVVNQVIGKPVALQLPTWSQAPDRVDVYVDLGGWSELLTTVTGDVSGVTEIDWPYNWDGQGGHAVYAVASRAGYQSASAATGVDTVRFAATQPPTIAGTAVPGHTLRFQQPAFNASPDATDVLWSNNAHLSDDAPAYRVSAADVGTLIKVQVRASFGSSTTTTTSPGVRVLAKSRLTARAKARGTKATVTFGLSTPGVTRPRGSVSIAAGGTVIKKYKVTTPPASRTVTIRVKRNIRKLTLTYSGTRTAAPAKKTVTVRR